MEYFANGIVILASVIIMWRLIIVPNIQLRIRQKGKSLKNESRDFVLPPKKKEADFYGLDKLENDPVGFLKEVSEKMKAVAHGESVGVNAAEALFFIRNSKDGVIVGGWKNKCA